MDFGAEHDNAYALKGGSESQVDQNFEPVSEAGVTRSNTAMFS